MELSIRRETLWLSEVVRSSRRRIDSVGTCMVTLTHDGITAYGEGTPSEYDGVTADDVVAALDAEGAVVLGRDLGDPDAALDRIARWNAPAGARMALDGAVHDWIGKAAGAPTWKLAGAPRTLGPTVYTLSMTDPEETVDAVRRAPAVGAFKVKVGGPGDLDALEAIRAVTTLPVRVDANGAWDFQTARALTPHLRRLGIQLIEQPFPVSACDDYHRYREVSQRLPVFLDEGCTDVASVLAASLYADGIVVKLCKAGGIRSARQVMEAGQRSRLGIMISCQCESELGISQAAQLAPLADHIDLDGHFYLKQPPFLGLALDHGRIVLGDAPGLGVVPARDVKVSPR
ncbi:mandelate racemase/muconate lactonizing enzyme family protein [Micromonospora sp. LOL_024]|uniref:mandelate racemase/muconate lactonizing enzyme family protein n=1 Tax=Micromonospora sp. LOL_024 TaxID=3345412 RepID=UPI003A88C471